MKNALRQNNSKFCLIGKINGLATEVRRARKCLINSKNEEAVWRHATRKKVVGVDIRHHLLAYAFLRGTPYKKLERCCAENNKPQAETIFKIVQAHAPVCVVTDMPMTKPSGEVCKVTVRGYYQVILKDVETWLTEEVV